MLLGSRSHFFARDMDGMIVEDEFDRRVGGVSGIEEFEKFNEFAAAVAFPVVHTWRYKIDDAA
jgi:hypothetical protein